MPLRSSCTTWRLRVRVPVLSVQITVTEPRASTAGRRRIRAARCTIRWVPIARVTVITAGRPSGTIATAIDRATSSRSSRRWPISQPSSTTTATRARAEPTSTLARPSSLSCSGVVSPHAVLIIWAIRPSSVCMPVAVTTARPRPRTTSVPWNRQFWRSSTGVAGSSTSTASLFTASASPVRAASRRPSSATSSRRASAGTRSPASTRIRSPGTSCSLGIRSQRPSRRTVTRGWAMLRRACRACWARLSCR